MDLCWQSNVSGFNKLSRFVISFLPRNKRLWISWLQSSSAVILEPLKVSHCFHCFPIYLSWSDGTRCHDLSFLWFWFSFCPPLMDRGLWKLHDGRDWLWGSSVQSSCSVVSNSLQSHGLQHDRPPCPSPTPGVYSNLCPLSRWCHPTIMLSPSPPAFNLSQHQGLFQWIISSHQVANVLEFQLQHQYFQWKFRTDFL